MKVYYIYHIAGIKIGCTSDLIKRMSDQGFTEWEILEEHTDIYEVSDREIELQKQYGLPVDKVPYWQSVANRHIWDDNTRVTWNSETSKIARALVKNPGCQKEESKLKLSISKSKLLNEADIIRERFKQWDLSKHKFELVIAKEYNVSRPTINRILRNLIY